MKNILSKTLIYMLCFCLPFTLVACGGSGNSGNSSNSSSTVDVVTLPEFDSDKYLFGMCELAAETMSGGDSGVTGEWIASKDSAFGVKSQRVWMHIPNVISRASHSNELSLKESVCDAYHAYFAQLKAAGIERILVMNHQFLYPYGYSNSDPQVAPDPNNDVEIYSEWLELYYDCYVLLATEFPEITFWECGNEFDLPQFMHKVGWTATNTDTSTLYSETESATITADLCYAANKAVKSVSKSNFIVLPGMSMNYSNTPIFFAAVYEAIESKNLPTIEPYYIDDPDEYFQIIAWHPYSGYSVDTFANTCNALYDIAKVHGDGEKRVWFTEIGFSESRFGGIDTDEAQNFIATQAIAVLERIKTDLPYVETCFWFRMSNCYSHSISDLENSFGLFYSPDDPENSGKPKPVAIALLKYFKGENADISVLG